MSRLKKIEGLLTFGDDADFEKFEKTISQLQTKFSQIAPVQGAITPLAPETRTSAPFIVALTFEERFTKPVYQRIWERIEEELPKLEETFLKIASAAAPGAGTVKLFADVVREFLAQFAKSAAAHLPDSKEDTAAAKQDDQDKTRKAAFDQIAARIKSWQSKTDQPFKDLDVTPTDVETVFNAVSSVAAGTEPGGAYDLTQLVGWLSPEAAKGATRAWNFEIQGEVRYATASYRDGGRFDVLGPNGAQLATKWLSAEEIEGLLEGSQTKVEMEQSADLLQALDRRSAADERLKQTRAIRGRFWLSNGKLFGVRQVAIFAPPAFDKVVGECCTSEEILPDEEAGCCDDEDERPEVIRAPVALAFGQTDETGYFEISYIEPQGWDKAGPRFALVQISGVHAALAVALEKTGGKTVRFPDPLLLQVNEALLRTPDEEDSIQWLDKETDHDDCGGNCYSEPNRALDEFDFSVVVRTTDPLITRKSLKLVNGKASLESSNDEAFAEGPSRLFRTGLNRDHRVVWDRDPLIAQAETIAHGRVLTMKQVWRADGYSLGDLLYSLPLAPLQKKNIAIIDWNRSDSFRRDEAQTNVDALSNYFGRERDISEIANSAIHESLRGSSSSGSRSSSSGGGISFPFLGFGSASGGSSGSSSESSQDSTKTLAATFLNSLRDKTQQSANSYRAQHVTVVQQIEQSERQKIVTETVANRNACHALTIQYFEVLRHYKVDFELASVRECLYIPLPLDTFDTEKVNRWRSSIERGLVDSVHVAGIRALERSENGYPYPKGQFADGNLERVGGEISLVLEFRLPASVSGAKKDSPPVALPPGYDDFQPYLQTCLALDPEKRDEYFRATGVASTMARKIVSGLRFYADASGTRYDLKLEAALATPFTSGREYAVNISLPQDWKAPKVKRKDITSLVIESSVPIPDEASVLLKTAAFNYSTYGSNFALVPLMMPNQRLSTTASGQVAARLMTPLQFEETKVLETEDKVAVVALIRHLNENLEYYHKAIWWFMDQDRRFTLLDSFIAPHSGGRSVASVVENRLVGIIGNSLVMPVAPGIRLDYLNDVETKDKDSSAGTDELLEAYRPLIPNPAVRISVPTKGVFAESVMGRCNACEKIDNSRNWKYWEHPLPDEPTAIEPISTASRNQPVTNPTATPMTAPIINQVHTTMQSVPDPSGLGKMLDVIGNPNTSRDMAGLPGTQQGAREALAASFDTTSKFGDLAAQAMMQAQDLIAKAVMTYFTGGLGAASFLDSAPGMKQSVGKDVKAGRITPQQGRQSIARINDAVTDAFKSSANKTLFDQPEISEAIKAGARKGAKVSATHGGSKVDIGEAPGQSDDEADEEPDRGRPWPLNWLLPNAEARTNGRSPRPTRSQPQPTSGTQSVKIALKRNGEGTLTYGGKTVPCLGMPGTMYPNDITIQNIEGEQNKGDYEGAYKFPLWISSKYFTNGRPSRMPWAVLVWPEEGIFIHEWPDGARSHGCIHLSPGTAEDFYNWIKGPTRIQISYPWKQPSADS
jgi:lipoprotein-anchoring transpeptidase ErfK/SrfK